MKAKTLQILWHGKDPVLTLDFHPSGLLATGGADKDIRLWQLSREEDGGPLCTFQDSLSHHNLPVNVVRFSPSGDMLASGGDGGELMLWKAVCTPAGSTSWKVVAVLKNHSKDVLDLCWSLDGTSLVSASVDNSCIIWDVAKGSAKQFLEGHQHFVQGIAWDPLGHFIVSQSADRSCRVYAPQPQAKGKHSKRGEGFGLQHTLAKRETAAGGRAPVETPQEGEAGPSKPPQTKHHMFQDENMPSFFRRLAWSPDGSFLITPAGLYKHTLDSKAVNTSYIFSRKDWSSAVMHLPGAGKSVVAVRFCPKLFKPLQNPVSEANAPDLSSAFKLLYRILYAVATVDSLFLYDTQRSTPIALLAGLHYAAISDIAWSADARYLAIASQDGYCTVVTFEEGELGELMPLKELPAHVAEHLPEVCRLRTAEAAVRERQAAQEASGQKKEQPKAVTPPPAVKETPDSAQAPPASHVELPAKRPNESQSLDVRPQKQARRINPIACTPTANVLADSSGRDTCTVVEMPQKEKEKPRRITPISSAPVVESTLQNEDETKPLRTEVQPGEASKRITPTSLDCPKQTASNSAAEANAEANRLERGGKEETKKRRMTPVPSRPALTFSPLEIGSKQAPIPVATTPVSREIGSKGSPALPKSISVTPRVGNASQSCPPKAQESPEQKPSSPIEESVDSPPAKGSHQPAKPIRRISPSPCKPTAGLEELARSASVEIARALSVEPVDGSDKKSSERS